MGGELDRDRQTCRRVEGGKQTFIGEIAGAAGLDAARSTERAFADEARAGILIARDMRRPRVDTDAVETDLPRHAPLLFVVLAIAQQPVAGKNSRPRPHEPSLHMHRIEGGIALVSGELVERELLIGGERQMPRSAARLGEPDAAEFDGLPFVERHLEF